MKKLILSTIVILIIAVSQIFAQQEQWKLGVTYYLNPARSSDNSRIAGLGTSLGFENNNAELGEIAHLNVLFDDKAYDHLDKKGMDGLIRTQFDIDWNVMTGNFLGITTSYDESVGPNYVSIMEIGVLYKLSMEKYGMWDLRGTYIDYFTDLDGFKPEEGVKFTAKYKIDYWTQIATWRMNWALQAGVAFVVPFGSPDLHPEGFIELDFNPSSYFGLFLLWESNTAPTVNGFESFNYFNVGFKLQGIL